MVLESSFYKWVDGKNRINVFFYFFWLFLDLCVRYKFLITKLPTRPWTLHSRTTSRGCSILIKARMDTGNGLLATYHLVVQLVPSSLLFVYSLDYAWACLANDAKAAKKGGERHLNGLSDVYHKTLKSDGIAGLYHGFNIACVGIIDYRLTASFIS